jgi:hypothetical protein
MRRDRLRRVALDLRGLVGMKDILRLSGGAKLDPAVDLWLADGPVELRSIAQKWFVQMRQCGDDVRELMHDGCPVACVEDAPFGYVNSFNTHVNVGFFHGAVLEDPAGLLEGIGKRMRHVKLNPRREVDAAALCELIDAAYLDIKVRLGKRIILGALNNGGPMRYDEEKIDEAVLAVLYLTAWEEQGLTRAWKGIDWDASNRLHQRGLIDDPRNKNKAVIFTEEGLARARASAEKLFSSGPRK